MSVISPSLTSKIIFRIAFKKKLDLKNPKTLNEKIIWLKLNTYKKNELVTQCADKVKVRDYLNESGLRNILVPLISVWNNTNDINWDELPLQFVLKCNHGWNYNIICINKSELDENIIKRQLDIWLKEDFWRVAAEINYRYIPKLILCEKYLVQSNGNPPDDYKVYCFNGLAKYILVCSERSKGKPKFYFFDENWNLARINQDSKEANKNFYISKPVQLGKMLQYACILSKPFPFVRVDFYIVDNNLFFSELTFTPSAGMDKARLPETDKMMGAMVNINYKGED